MPLTISPLAPWQEAISTRSVQFPKTAEGLGMQVRYKQDTGVIVWTVDVHKAAWAAGLRAGDVLHSIDGQVLESIDHLLERLFEVEVGGVISMEVRGRGSKPEPKPEPRPEPKLKPKPEPKPKPKPEPKPKPKPRAKTL